jgi:predicted N-acetyltransferase YhbS
MFGPIGVIERARGQGIGRELLLSGLRAMAALGYAYAIIGGAISSDFYSRVVSVIEIPDSTPGIYVDRLAK